MTRRIDESWVRNRTRTTLVESEHSHALHYYIPRSQNRMSFKLLPYLTREEARGKILLWLWWDRWSVRPKKRHQPRVHRWSYENRHQRWPSRLQWRLKCSYQYCGYDGGDDGPHDAEDHRGNLQGVPLHSCLFCQMSVWQWSFRKDLATLVLCHWNYACFCHWHYLAAYSAEPTPTRNLSLGGSLSCFLNAPLYNTRLLVHKAALDCNSQGTKLAPRENTSHRGLLDIGPQWF